MNWFWGASDDEAYEVISTSTQDKEIVITNPHGKDSWLNQLDNDERDRLYKAIGYKTYFETHTPEVRIDLGLHSEE